MGIINIVGGTLFSSVTQNRLSVWCQLYKTHILEVLAEVLGKTLKNKNISEHCPRVKLRERKLQW